MGLEDNKHTCIDPKSVEGRVRTHPRQADDTSILFKRYPLLLCRRVSESRDHSVITPIKYP